MIGRLGWTAVLSGLVATVAGAQTAAIAPAQEQITAAVLPLPADARASATVLGYGSDGKLTMLRKGSGSMTCLADDPKVAQFHVACYHESMEPFMLRGRQLRASGVTGTQVDSVRFREARAGTLKLPNHPASLYSLTGGTFDPKTGTTAGCAIALRGLHPVRDGSDDRAERQAAGERSVDHVRGDAEGAHHVHAENELRGAGVVGWCWRLNADV